MNKMIFDALVILITALLLTLLYQLNLGGDGLKFMLVPLIAFYYLGQYSLTITRKNKNV